MEVEMEKKPRLDIPVDLEAARLAVEWKERFAVELGVAARLVATGAEIVTADHFRSALASATAAVLHTANKHLTESANVHRRIA
jgi:hypothetical protein